MKTATMNKLVGAALAGVVITQLGGCAAAVVGGAAATGTAVALDRRSTGVFIGDQEIEMRTKARMRDLFPIKVANSIAPTSFNRQVLLTGTVPDQATKDKAGDAAAAVQDVRKVFNELTVGGERAFGAGANDAAITSAVKTRMLRDDRVPATKIKIVTETNVVYLLGLVTRAEAAVATEVARNTSAVSKVVVLFEYLD